MTQHTNVKKPNGTMVRNSLGLMAAVLLLACQQIPGSRTEQTTGGGAAAGAAVGAAAMENDLIGALLGGAAGAAGGYLIGARTDWFGNQDGSTAAREAVENARQNPARAAAARRSETADLNDDGFVTMDELIAMEQAGLGEAVIIDRLQKTEQVFQLSEDQRQRLMDAGLSASLVAEIGEINRDTRDGLFSGSEVISQGSY